MKKSLTILMCFTAMLCKAQLSIPPGTYISSAKDSIKVTNIGAIFSPYKPPVVIPPPVIVVPPTNTVYVGDGVHSLTIDGKATYYAKGTNIVIKPGNYTGGINIANLEGLNIIGHGVTLDGLNQTKNGFYNVLSLTNLSNTRIVGINTKNNGYHNMYFNNRIVNVTLDSVSFVNTLQGVYQNNDLVWDGTDNTVQVLNLKIINSTFDNAGTMYIGGSIGGDDIPGKTTGDHKIHNLIKGLEIAYCTFKNYDGGNAIQAGAADKFNIHDNSFVNLNATYNGDTRLISMTGNGDVFNNTCANYEGHFAAVNPVSFGQTLSTSHFYNNTCTNGRRYAAFEFQEFSTNNIPGLTTKSNLEVYNNTVTNIGLDKWTGYPATFIDNYQGYTTGCLGGTVSLINNTGSNWFPVPKVYGTGLQLFNLAPPTVYTGNLYK